MSMYEMQQNNNLNHMVFKFNELKEIKESYVFYTTAGNMQCLQYSSLMLYM